MSTSKKMQDFTSEPMGTKSVKDLAGIGNVLGDKLVEKVFQCLFFSYFSSCVSFNILLELRRIRY